MTMVIAGELPPEIAAWREERRRLGQDRYDEVWEGVYHLAPGPTGPHGYVDSEVAGALRPLARRAGLHHVTATDLGSADDFRVPDGMVLRTRPTGTCTGTAAVVVEVLSPGDETFAKFAFHAGRGVDEVLVADPEGRSVRLWQRRDGGCAETGRSDLLGVTGEELAAQVDWP